MYKTIAEAAEQSQAFNRVMDKAIKDHDPAFVDGERTAKAIMTAEGPKIYALLQEAKKLVKGKGSPRDRFDQLVTISDKLSQTITPYTPCKNGCNHCCYMAVGISDIEAESISRYTGKAMAIKGQVEEYLEKSDELIAELAGTPCTFLDDKGKCSIYPVRPIACRTHHNLGPSAQNCRIKDVVFKQNTPILPLNAIQHVGVDIAMLQAKVGFGDIREYFPNGKN